jgi:hypothetical protein
MVKQKIAMMRAPSKTLSPHKVNCTLNDSPSHKRKVSDGQSPVYDRLLRRAITDKNLIS